MQFTSKSIVKAILSAILIFVAAFGWFSIGLSRRQPLTSMQSEEGVTADGTNDSPPEYDRAIRGKNMALRPGRTVERSIEPFLELSIKIQILLQLE